MSQARDILDSALATAMHAMRTTVATTLGSTPGSLAFSRDMFLNIPLIADCQTIAARREQFVNENLRRANAKRRQFDYAAGQQVLKKVHDPTKLGVRTSGPHRVRRVHANGTLTIDLCPGVTERINIRRLIPYKTPTNSTNYPRSFPAFYLTTCSYQPKADKYLSPWRGRVSCPCLIRQCTWPKVIIFPVLVLC